MCVPCAFAVPGLGEILLFVLIGLIVAVGVCFKWVVQAVPYVMLGAAAVVLALYRWCSGAVLSKPVNTSDDDHWGTVTRQGHRGPRFTRAVRATFRLTLMGLGIGLMVNWLATALVVGTLSVVVSGGALYGRRDRIVTTARQLTGRTRELVRR